MTLIASPRSVTALPAASSTIGPLDYLLGVGHVSLIASIFADIFNGNQLVAVATGVGEVGLILGHTYYRKYGMIGKSVDLLERSEAKLHADVKKEGDIEIGLGKTAALVTTAAENFQQDNSQLKTLLAVEKQQNEQLSKQLEEYRKSIASLHQTAAGLTASTAQMGQLVLEVQVESDTLANNESQMAKEEEKVEASISSLEKVAVAIGSAVELFAKVKEEFKRNQQSIEEQQRQNQELQSQILHLEELLAALQKDEAGLGQTEQKIRQDIQGLEEMKQKLIVEIDLLEKQQDRLHKDVDELKTVVETLRTQSAAFSTDGRALLATIAQFRSETVEGTRTLSESNASLQQQLKKQAKP